MNAKAILVGSFCFLISVFLLWIGGFWLFLSFHAHPATQKMTDGIVVLTGGAGRIDRGLMMLERHQAKRMLVSGVNRQVKAEELAALYNIPSNLIECCVDLGTQAVDTSSNAKETAEWITLHRYHSVRLITTDWHMARARFELSLVIGKNIQVVEDAIPSHAGWRVWILEYCKYLWRRFSVAIGFNSMAYPSAPASIWRYFHQK
ncbi:MAG: YdcF family protein [Zymomonas mobilis]|uniref:Uncharacterized SAM-binding protein YcdF (DUF218 family) n=1 Tax=Zymomonas mobilis TaxID=542 RepID=A0A542W002_ZYMMB|nr:YdcF family protein [Zymomonas mobilis]TQL16908.1 uncharacterized SAM-binding protein YcdF (DUF218 family) [Zymomonas mobilis]